MIDSHKIDYSKLETLNVSRETFLELDEFKEMILDENKKINIKELIIAGKDRGFLTYAEINDHLPDDITDTDQKVD